MKMREMFRMFKDFPKDLALVIFLTLLCIAFVLIPSLSEMPVRIIIGLPFVLFIPGYSLIAVLFPGKNDLDGIERIALSFGLSIAIVPLLGLILNYTPFGIRSSPILAVLSIFVILLAICAQIRRSKLPKENRFVVEFARFFKGMKEFGSTGSRIDRILSIVLILSIILAISAIVYVIITPKQGEKFTEFYILGPGGKASDYPTNLLVGENATVIMGIANHEYRIINYTVEIWLVNSSYEDNKTRIHQMYFMDSLNITLDYTDTNIEGNWTPQWEKPYTFTIDKPGAFKIWFLLFKDSVIPPDEKMRDYAGTDAEKRIIDAIAGDIQGLNLNIVVV